MIYCTRCGAPATGYGVFCASCGAKMVSAERPDQSASPEAPLPQIAGSESAGLVAGAGTSWWHPLRAPGQIRRLIVAGFAVFGGTLALSAILGIGLLYFAAAIFSAAFGDSLGSTSGNQGVVQSSSATVGDYLHGLLAFTSYVFFASHFSPLEASGLGGATYSIVGIGSVTIALASLLSAFFFQRYAERQLPASAAGPAFWRGSLIGLPYGIGALALFVPTAVSIGSTDAAISIRPSPLGIVLAAAVAGIGGGLGAASIRTIHHAAARAIVEGAARGTLAIALGAGLTTVVAVTGWIAISAGHSPGPTPSPGVPPTDAVQHLGWSIAALIPFYLINAVALIWSTTLGGSLFSSSSAHFLVYTGPIGGALLGALRLRSPAARIEQAAFAGAFALGTGVLGLVTTPAILNGPSRLSNLWSAFGIAAVIGAGAALVGPYLQTRRLVASFAAGPLAVTTWPLLTIWPSIASAPQLIALEMTPQEAVPVRLRLGRLYAALAVGLVVLLSGILVANSQLAPRFSPETTALSYLAAESRGDAAAMWAHMTFQTGASSTQLPFLTLVGLKAMLSIGDNQAISALSLRDTTRQDDDNYLVAVDLRRAGQSDTVQLHLRRDVTRANWLIYPYWVVVVVPSIVNVTTYRQAGRLTVDGIDSRLSSESGAIALIPGTHRVELAPTDVFTSDSRLVDASGDTTVIFDPQLASTPSTALNKAIGGLFGQCANANTLSPAGCPNSASPIAGFRQSRIHWTQVGDPLAGMSVTAGDAIDSVIASGSWQMHISFDYWSGSGSARVRRWDQDISGTYSLTLSWNGTDFVITNRAGTISSAAKGVSSVPAPTVTAALIGASPLNQGYAWQIAGQYFTPRQTIEVFLVQPPYPGAAAAPGLIVSPDGTFSSPFGLASHAGKATIKACDSTGLCATVPVNVP